MRPCPAGGAHPGVGAIDERHGHSGVQFCVDSLKHRSPCPGEWDLHVEEGSLTTEIGKITEQTQCIIKQVTV